METRERARSEEVVRRLTDADPAVREQAVRDLVGLVPAPDDVLTLLLDRLADPTAGVVRTAMSALRSRGLEDPMAYQLSQLAKSPDPAARLGTIVAIEWAIADGGFDPGCLLEVLEEAAHFGGQQDDYRYITRAVEAITSLGTPAIESLTQFLSARNRKLVVEACSALTGFGPGAACAVRPLTALLQRPWDEVRYQALQALKAIGPAARDAVPTLVADLESGTISDEEVDTLAAIGPAARAAVPLLMRLLIGLSPDEDYYDDLLASVAGALRDIGYEHIADHPEVAADIVHVLTDRYFGVDIDFASNESVIEAVIAICRVAATEAVPALLTRLRTSEDLDTSNAGYLLERLGVDAIPSMLKWAVSSPLDRDARASVAEALALAIGESARPALRVGADDPDPQVRALAEDLLHALDSAALQADYEEYLRTREAGEPRPVGTVPTSAEDERTLKWFEEVDMTEYLTRLQVFWCIGQVDHTAFESAGRALGWAKLQKALKEHRPTFTQIRLPTSSGYIRHQCLEVLDGLFDREPFYSSAWSDDERGMALRNEYMYKNRKESCWTRKARTALGYVERFLSIKGLLPEMTAAGGKN